MSENSPVMTLPLVKKLNFHGMMEYGNNLLLGRDPDIDNIITHTKSYLRHLCEITKTILDKPPPITLENYIKEVKILGKSMSLGPYVIIPAMVKTKAMDMELVEIVGQCINYP